MLENGWCSVGAQGKHRHVPSRPGPLKSTPECNPIHSTQAPQAELHDCQLSLLALPATALASVFHHLDSVAGCSLAQTCHACAIEFAHRQADFTQKYWEELAPAVTRDPPRGGQGDYGTTTNPVSLLVKWEKNPGSVLRRLYAISQQPDCEDVVHELWRQAWPQALWSDLLCNGLPPRLVIPMTNAGIHAWNTSLNISIKVQISSDEPLQLPWDWLAQTLLYAPAAGLRCHLEATAPQQLRKDLQEQRFALTDHWSMDLGTCIGVCLYRPAQADQLQEIMSRRFHCDAECLRAEWGLYDDPCYEQKVAITGSWCQALPNASCALWRALFEQSQYRYVYDRQSYHHDSHDMHVTLGDDVFVDPDDRVEHLEESWRAHFGCHMHGMNMTAWDEAAVDLNHVAEHLEALWRDLFGCQVSGVTAEVAERIVDDLKLISSCECFDECLPSFSHRFLMLLASMSVDSDFKDFTCEIAGQSDWKRRRQAAKGRGNSKSKKAKAAGRRQKAGMSRSYKASLFCQDIRQSIEGTSLAWS